MANEEVKTIVQEAEIHGAERSKTIVRTGIIGIAETCY